MEDAIRVEIIMPKIFVFIVVWYYSSAIITLRDLIKQTIEVLQVNTNLNCLLLYCNISDRTIVLLTQVEKAEDMKGLLYSRQQVVIVAMCTAGRFRWMHARLTMDFFAIMPELCLMLLPS